MVVYPERQVCQEPVNVALPGDKHRRRDCRWNEGSHGKTHPGLDSTANNLIKDRKENSSTEAKSQAGATGPRPRDVGSH